jgi:hypothetical protein
MMMMMMMIMMLLLLMAACCTTTLAFTPSSSSIVQTKSSRTLTVRNYTYLGHAKNVCFAFVVCMMLEEEKNYERFLSTLKSRYDFLFFSLSSFFHLILLFFLFFIDSQIAAIIHVQ